MARPATGSVVERKTKRGGTVYALRFRAYGARQYQTLGSTDDGWDRGRADEELANVLADVRRGIWRPPAPATEPGEPPPEPTFHEFASEWLAAHKHEFAPRTVEDYTLSLTHHLLPFFKGHKLSEITAAEVDRYKAAKVREREAKLVDRPLSNTTINKHLIRLGQVLDAAVRYDLIPANPVKTKVSKLKVSEPSRRRMQGQQVQTLLRVAGRNRALLATAIMAGGLRVSELTHLRWRDLDLPGGLLYVESSKTDAGVRAVSLEPELVQLLRAHKLASKWSQPGDYVFPGRRRDKPRDRNAVRNRVLYPAIERANKALGEAGQSTIPKGVTFHGLRRTYAALRAELGEHPSITAAQMGHSDPRMTLRVYTDVTGVRPSTRMAGLLDAGTEWATEAAPMGTSAQSPVSLADRSRSAKNAESA